MRYGGIVLCGGKSSRMGLPKATLPFGAEPMLSRVVRLLSEVAKPIVVVAARGQQLPDIAHDAILTYDQRADCGPLEGLYAGLLAIQDHAPAAYATSCDVPLIATAFVQQMFDLLNGHSIAVPRDGKYHHPLAAVYHTKILPNIKALIDADRMRPFFLFQQVDTLEVPVDQLRPFDAELATLENLNRPEDYISAMARAGLNVPPEVLAKLHGSGNASEQGNPEL